MPRKKKPTTAAAAVDDADSDPVISDSDVDESEEEEVEEEDEDEILAAALETKIAAAAASATAQIAAKMPPPSAKAKAKPGRTKKVAKKKKPPPAAKAKPKSKAAAKSKASKPTPTSSKAGSPGARKTKPRNESQTAAKARCQEARSSGLALLAPLALDERESALRATGRRTLRDPEDDHYISPLNCLVRSQIEIFRAAADHPKAQFVHQVGLRCVNCATACEYAGADPVTTGGETRAAAAGAEKFPQCKDNLGAAIRNWHRTHVVHCPHRPADVIPVYDALRAMQVRACNKGINYYARAHDRLDLVDVTDAVSGISGMALRAGSEQEEVLATSAGMAQTRGRAAAGRRSGASSGATSSSVTPTKRAASAAPSSSVSASASSSAKKKKKKLEWKPKASVAAILGGIEPSPLLRSDPDRTSKKLYNSDEYLSGSSDGGGIGIGIGSGHSSSEEEIEVSSDEESDDESDNGVDLHRKPSAASAKQKTGTPDEYKEVEALDLGTMERVGLYRATADAAAQLAIDCSIILKACRDGGGYVEQYFIRFANEDGAAHAADIAGTLEAVYQPTEEEVQRYIERARRNCAESAAQKRDEDYDLATAASDDGGGGPTAEERYGDLVDSLAKEVMKIQQGTAGAEEVEAADAEVADARQQLIRHQLLYRMKMADKAGVAPGRFCKRYMAQLRVNDERESKTQRKKKAKKKARSSSTSKKAGRTKDGSSSRSPATSRTIGMVCKAAEAAIRKRKSESKTGKKSAADSSGGKKDAKTGKAIGHWSEEEDILLLQAMTKYGHDWSACSTLVGSRTHIQCKSRHQKMEAKGLIVYD